MSFILFQISLETIDKGVVGINNIGVVCSTVIRTTSRRWNVFIEARQTDACQYGKCYTGMVILKQNENKHNL